MKSDDKRVLILEAESHYVRAHAQLLSNSGMTVCIVGNERDGLKAVEEERPGVVFSDYYRRGDATRLDFMRDVRARDPSISRYFLAASPHYVREDMNGRGETIGEQGIVLDVVGKGDLETLLAKAEEGFARYGRLTAPKYRLIIVDDESFILRAFSRTLSGCGYDILTLTDPTRITQALEESAKAGYAVPLVITDTNMPLMDGTDVARAAMRHDPDVSVVIMSAGRQVNEKLYDRIEREVGSRLTERAEDPLTFLQKPWDDDHLIELVRAKVEQYKALKR